jgi:uncharacterized membrane protein YfcA
MWEDIWLYVAIGFAAQMVDGAIGMAYGLTSTSFLLSLGIPPATASACVHAAETFTTAVSGASHWKFGNVDWRLVRRLAIPGAIGGGIGAYVLSNLDGNLIKPYIAGYLLLMGLFILWKAVRPRPQLNDEPPKHVGPLGFFGGLVDSIGGGGWGPIVTTTLIGSGTVPRYAIGSVNLTEFFVTLTISATFMFTIGLDLFPIIAGLLVGGIIAAPFAAYVTKHLPDTVMMILVGFVIVGLSLRTILIALY